MLRAIGAARLDVADYTQTVQKVPIAGCPGRCRCRRRRWAGTLPQRHQRIARDWHGPCC
jgi:hypothetical protein